MLGTRRCKLERLDFVVAGAQKSGTTALHYFLSKHPNITMGDQQEIHFFDDDALFVSEPDYEELHKHYGPLGPSTIAGAPPAQARRFAYVDRGFYGQQLARLFKFFPRDQVKAVKFEHFRDKQRETLTSVFSFLGLEPLRSVRSKDRNVVPYERAMNWEERIFLYNLFAEDITKVEQLLGWDCSEWKL